MAFGRRVDVDGLLEAADGLRIAAEQVQQGALLSQHVGLLPEAQRLPFVGPRLPGDAGQRDGKRQDQGCHGCFRHPVILAPGRGP